MRKISLEEFNKNKGKFEILSDNVIDFFDEKNTIPRVFDFAVTTNEKTYSNENLDFLIVSKKTLKNYLEKIVKIFDKKIEKEPDTIYFWKFMTCVKTVQSYPDWKFEDEIKPRLYIMQVRDMENGLFYARWHEFERWSYTGSHFSGGSIEAFYGEISLEDVKRKTSTKSTDFYLKISMETVDMLVDDIWEKLEKEKMNIKEELEITPYEKKNMSELF